MFGRVLFVVAVMAGTAVGADSDRVASEGAGSDGAASEGADHEVQRPIMRQLPPQAAANQPPGSRALVDARAEVRRRYKGVLAQAKSGGGATRAAETLLDAATNEGDRRLKWALLEEARRQAAAAGNALLVERAVGLAAAVYDFDAISEEYQALNAIPLRGIDEPRAAALAQVAEQLSGRAESDGRRELAAAAQALAIRGWQRAGDDTAARRAAARLVELDPERVPGRR